MNKTYAVYINPISLFLILKPILLFKFQDMETRSKGHPLQKVSPLPRFYIKFGYQVIFKFVLDFLQRLLIKEWLVVTKFNRRNSDKWYTIIFPCRVFLHSRNYWLSLIRNLNWQFNVFCHSRTNLTYSKIVACLAPVLE